MLHEEVGVDTLVEAAELYRHHPPCPSDGEAPPRRDVLAPLGVRRWRRTSYGAVHLTHRRRAGELQEVARDLGRLRHAGSIRRAARVCAEMSCITHQVVWEWRHRLFSAVDNYQDRIVMRGRAWVEETYVSDTDLSIGYG